MSVHSFIVHALVRARLCVLVCVRACVYVHGVRRLPVTPGLCPHLDVHHKHNQDEEQPTGQAGAVPRDPLHSLPDGPQPGLGVSEPLL